MRPSPVIKKKKGVEGTERTELFFDSAAERPTTEKVCLRQDDMRRKSAKNYRATEAKAESL